MESRRCFPRLLPRPVYSNVPQRIYKVFINCSFPVYFVSTNIAYELLLWSERFNTRPNPSKQRINEEVDV
jgi:hypothetical protein